MLQTEPSGGIPAGLRKRPAVDDLAAMLGGDDEPRTLYVNRPLTNAEELLAWARSVGFKKTLPASDVHVTLAFSRAPVDWSLAQSDEVSREVCEIDAGQGRTVERLGDKGAVVLRFEAPVLEQRWKQLRDLGAVWDFPEYKPHVTLTYDAGDLDLSTVTPYDGPLDFGPEVFAEVDEGWAEKAKGALVAADELSLDAVFSESDHPRAPDGKFGSGGSSSKSDEPKTLSKAGPAGLPFVNEFMKAHTTMKEQAAYLEKQPREKLQKALDLIEKHKAIDPGARHVKQMITAALGKSQANDFKVRTDSALRLALDRESVREMDRDGRMRIKVANISKATVNPYKGHEIPDWETLGLDPERIYNLLRDPEELRKAAASFNGVQILRKHTPVSASDAQQWDVVGSTGTNATFDEPYLKNSLNIWTKEAIDEIEAETKRELSCGYHYVPVMEPGEFEGQRYDGRMTQIVGNHVALVKDGRAGADVLVGDSAESLQWSCLEDAFLAAWR